MLTPLHSPPKGNVMGKPLNIISSCSINFNSTLGEHWALQDLCMSIYTIIVGINFLPKIKLCGLSWN